LPTGVAGAEGDLSSRAVEWLAIVLKRKSGRV
jgi:hypothetical protein